MTDRETRKEKILTWTKKIEQFKNNLWVNYDRKQADHRTFKSDNKQKIGWTKYWKSLIKQVEVRKMIGQI